MASEMPPADAEQPKSLLAQYHKRLMWRLAAWGGAAAFSLVTTVIVSQTASGHKRLQIALSGSDQPYEIPASVATATVAMPPADLIAVKRATEAMRRTTEEVKRATDQTAARLETVERNTAETRAETRRLALQMSKLSTDSIRVTGRLTSIENQVGGITGSINDITGSIKKQAEEAAAAAVAKAMPPRPAFDNVYDMNAPIISPPATTYPKLSLIVPPKPGSSALPMTAGAPKLADKSTPDVATTSSITMPEAKSKDQSRVGSNVAGTAAPEAKRMAKAAQQPQELKAGVGVEAKPARERPTSTEPETTQSVPPVKTASAFKATHRRASSRHWIPTHGYGVDLGGAESVTVAQAQWAAVKANFGPILVGMRPLVVRNHRLLSTGDYRLVVGRTRSLASAEKLCKRLALQLVTCQPIEFDNGRMVWR
jgi:hypothetical protein